MPRRPSSRPSPAQPRALQHGFTLLEVLVAMVLIGFGLAIAFTAISGTARLDDKINGHTAAMALAQAKLDEALANPTFAVADDAVDQGYAGTDFGYRIHLRPFEALTRAQQERLPAFRQKIEEVEVEVFWGPKGNQQVYRLNSYRLAPPPPGERTAGGAAAPTSSTPQNNPQNPVRPTP
ncbi:prepilin-type N-terminal cleavage/methylation domain-containing protein [Acidovorax soli]|uniref:Prepilin-type N-terminal cleavage/methylation domain-containing protein n=1 Tax=Acidovorax soli TaxID=592050 RepID=A0A7X0UAM3_9BURK|nr:prepilin-type N-terminal cleavage/methylation domain-containing protein [Acidovorax soli]MBB6561406.1 prepilin-type N-terminal cleavage/methylation domain-containing protein [Acidovorax soli]